MTKVFVHGNPETRAVWDVLFRELESRGVRDLVALEPPGFGAPVPDGWGATQDEYASWLVSELKAIGGDIDLVGHDWGAGHVFGALVRAPGIVRTWAADCAGLMHPDYVWHDAAQGWQTDGVGEQMVDAITGMTPDDFAAVMGPLGMGEGTAHSVSQDLDEATARCILALYRSAAQPAMRRLGEKFGQARPRNGLVIVAENDHYTGTQAMHEEVASWSGATVRHIPGAGHWWMVEKPDVAAGILTAHWAR